MKRPHNVNDSKEKPLNKTKGRKLKKFFNMFFGELRSDVLEHSKEKNRKKVKKTSQNKENLTKIKTL